jgi:serine/threonine protein kinase/cytochrome c5
MPTVLTCSQGHRWELPVDAAARLADLQFACPVCGTPTPVPAQEEVVRAGKVTDGPALTIDDSAARATRPAEGWDPGAAPTTPPPSETPLPISWTPPEMPGYEILGELGRGGMGVVYQARHTKLKRLVALKMVLSGVHAGPKELARFYAEAEAVAQLQHPNIVQIYEVGEHEGRPFFSLEYVDGGSLAQFLKQHALSPADAARLVETLARAVHYAHQLGIVHRDLKPANILLAASSVQWAAGSKETAGPGQTAGGSRDGVPSLPAAKITDFGLAKRLDSQVGHTQSGAILGTAGYMAPEQAGGKTKEIGPAVDVWALGAILYELLAGRPPFIGETPMDTMLRVMSDDPPPPSRLNPRVPRDLETVCLKCLEKKPARRYASAQDLADDLRRFLDGRPVTARRITYWGRAVKWARRRPEMAALAGVLLVLASTVAAWALLQPREEEQSRRRAVELAPRAQRILHKYCYECHGQDAKNIERKLDVSNYDLLIDEKRNMVVAGHPELSRLVQRIEDESMPPQKAEEMPRVSHEELDILRAWVRGGAPRFPEWTEPPKPPELTAEEAALAAQVKQVFKTYCHSCHNYRKLEGGIKIMNHDHLVAKRKVIIPGDPDGSELYQLMVTDEPDRIMPPPEEKKRPTPAEIEAVRRWIELGAPPFPRAAR